MSAPEATVAVAGLVRAFGRVRAVDGVSFVVRPREMLGLIGPDGAGKTTTLRCVLGLLHPDAGEVLTLGLEPARRRRELSRRVGYLSQRFSLYGDLSVDENLAFFGRIHGVRGWRARRDELLDRLDLARFRDRLADRLSGGMRQKLALACTLVHTPDLLVLDEPTTGVDPVSRRGFWRILNALRAEGLTILLTTPYLDEAERCDRVALIDRGRILVLDEPEALRRGARGTMMEVLARPKRRALEVMRGLDGVTDVQTFGERLHALLDRVPPSGAASEAERLAGELARAGLEVDAVRPTPPSLEDVFIARIRAADPADARTEARR